MPDFGDVEIPDFLPADVAPAAEYFGLTPDEVRTTSLLHFFILNGLICAPDQARTVTELYRVARNCLAKVRTLAATNGPRAFGLVLGAVRYLEQRGLVACDPSVAGPIAVTPGLALTTVRVAPSVVVVSGLVSTLTTAACLLGQEELEPGVGAKMLGPHWRPRGS